MIKYQTQMMVQRLVFFNVGLVLGIKYEEITNAGLSPSLAIPVIFAVLVMLFALSESMVKQ